jgi:hypothetical protein
MKLKTVIVLLSVCAALGAAAVFITRPQPAEEGGAALGQKLLPDLPVHEISAITLVGPDETVRLKLKNDAWTVASRFDFPADFATITRLVQQLRDMKIGRAFEADAEVTERLALNPPGTDGVSADQVATRITLLSAQESPLVDLLLGKTSPKTDTQFVLPVGKTQVYLVDQSFRSLGKTAAEWLDTGLLDIAAEKIHEVVARDPKTGDTRYTLRRPAEGQPAELMAAPRERKVRQAKVDEVFEALSSLEIEDVADPGAAIPADGDLVIAYRLFDGTTYTLAVGPALPENPEAHFLRVQAAIKTPAAEGQDAPASDGTSEIAETNRRLGAWTYVIPHWRRDSFVGDLQSLLEPAAAGEAEK